MILFVTGQYAGAQYIHPLLQKWGANDSPKWQLVATSTSCKYWDEWKVPYEYMTEESADKISSYLGKIKPSLVVVSASANVVLEYLFIIEARKKKLPTASYIDVWNNYRSRFQFKEEKIYPDNVLAIDARCEEEMIADEIPEDIIKVIGQPYLEEVATKEPALGNHLLIASQPIRKHRKLSLGYDEAIFWNICLKAIEKLDLDHVYATRHPDEEFDITQPTINGVTWAIGKGLDDVANSHTVLGMFSMQMIIGYLWGRKVASIQPGLCENDPSPLSRWGLIPKLDDVEDVVAFINEPFTHNNNIELKANLMGSTNRLESFCLTR